MINDWQASRLTVGDIRDLRLQENLPLLAYLSACSTGATQSEKPDNEDMNIIGVAGLHLRRRTPISSI